MNFNSFHLGIVLFEGKNAKMGDNFWEISKINVNSNLEKHTELVELSNILMRKLMESRPLNVLVIKSYFLVKF